MKRAALWKLFEESSETGLIDSLLIRSAAHRMLSFGAIAIAPYAG
jgi:hypothetical protein